jgi:hypothetical protein
MKIDANIVEFEILTVVTIKKAVVWAVLLHNLVSVNIFIFRAKQKATEVGHFC